MAGQYNQNGEAEGLVRFIYPNGDVYEGEYSRGSYNGFGVLYQADSILIGWWKDRQRIGNYIDLDLTHMTVKD